MRFSTTFRRWYRDDVILQIGRVSISRERLVRDYHCSNFRAATLLHGALAALQVTTVGGLMRLTPSDLLACDGVGERTVFVATCLIDTFGGDVPAWLDSDQQHRHRGIEPLAVPPSVQRPSKLRPHLVRTA